MKVQHNAVVTVTYKLTDDAGELIDENLDEPLAYLHGHGQIVPGLERALAGRAAQDRIQVSVTPEDGYGVRGDEELIEVPLEELPDDVPLEVGLELDADSPEGDVVTLWVADINETHALLDTYHPLAGQTLHFDVTIVEVREGKQEEVEHGHAHATDGDPTHH